MGGTNPTTRVLTVSLAAGQTGTDYNFAEVPPGDLYGYVYVDANLNGRQDPGEPPLGGVAVTISGTAFAGTAHSPSADSCRCPGRANDVHDGQWPVRISHPSSGVLHHRGRAARRVLAGGPGDHGPAAKAGVGFGTAAFSNVTVGPVPVLGSFNFGEVLADPGKRGLLASTLSASLAGSTGTSPGSPPGSPSFSMATGTPSTPAYVVTAPGPGLAPLVRVFDYATGGEVFRFNAFDPTFTGGVRVAVGDVTGDGVPDIVAVAGPGGGPIVNMFDGNTGKLVRSFFAFEPSFRGGLFVAIGDVNHDGYGDVIVGTDAGGGPRVAVFSGQDGSLLETFFAFDPTERGGVRVAAADFDHDGYADIVTVTGPGVSTEVRIFSGATNAVLADYSPFEAAFTGGVNIAVGDYNGDGVPDVILGAEAGGGPRVQVLSGLTTTRLADFYAYEPSFSGGVRVAAQDVNGDGKADLVVAAGPGGSARVQVYLSPTLQLVDNFYAYQTDFNGGTYVA